MIYPKKIKAKKSNIIVKILLASSIIIALILIFINKVTTPKFAWAAIVNAGMLYTWITVIYAIRKNTNIAGHILLQAIAISSFAVYIDYKLGFSGWSLNIAIPIIIIIANSTMLVVTIISHKKYIKYAIYQLMIVLISMIPMVLPVIFITENMLQDKTLSVIASGISILNFVICLSLCTKDFKEAIIRKFHI